jgi:hypothetical protein
MTEKDSSDQTQTAPDSSDAKGIRAGLTEAQRAMRENTARGGDAGLPRAGKRHPPTHASGNQGPAEKKVRW